MSESIILAKCNRKSPIPEDAYNNELTRQSETVVRRLRYSTWTNAFTADLPEDLRLNIRGAK